MQRRGGVRGATTTGTAQPRRVGQSNARGQRGSDSGPPAQAFDAVVLNGFSTEFPSGPTPPSPRGLADLRRAAAAHEAAVGPRIAELQQAIALAEGERHRQAGELAQQVEACEQELHRTQQEYAAALQHVEAQLAAPSLARPTERETQLLHAIRQHQAATREKQAAIDELQRRAEALRETAAVWDGPAETPEDLGAEDAIAQLGEDLQRVESAIATLEAACPDVMAEARAAVMWSDVCQEFREKRAKHIEAVAALEAELQRCSPAALARWRRRRGEARWRAVAAVKAEELRALGEQCKAHEWVSQCRFTAADAGAAAVATFRADTLRRLQDHGAELQRRAEAAVEDLLAAQRALWRAEALAALLGRVADRQQRGGSPSLGRGAMQQLEVMAEAKADLALQALRSRLPAVLGFLGSHSGINGELKLLTLPLSADSSRQDDLLHTEALLVNHICQSVKDGDAPLCVSHHPPHRLADDVASLRLRRAHAGRAVLEAGLAWRAYEALVKAWDTHLTPFATPTIGAAGEAGSATGVLVSLLAQEQQWLTDLHRQMADAAAAPSSPLPPAAAEAWRGLEEEERRWGRVVAAHRDCARRRPRPGDGAEGGEADGAPAGMANPTAACHALLARQRDLQRLLAQRQADLAEVQAAAPQRDAAAYTAAMVTEVEAALATHVSELQACQAMLAALGVELAGRQAVEPPPLAVAPLERLRRQHAAVEDLAGRLAALQQSQAEAEAEAEAQSLAAIRPLREELETLCEQSERVRHLLSLAERHPQADPPTSARPFTPTTPTPAATSTSTSTVLSSSPVPETVSTHTAHTSSSATSTPRGGRARPRPRAMSPTSPLAPRLDWMREASTGLWCLFGPHGPRMTASEAASLLSLLDSLTKSGTPVALRRGGRLQPGRRLCLASEVTRLEVRRPAKRVAESFVLLEQVESVRSGEFFGGMRIATPQRGTPDPDGFPFTLTMADRPALTLYCAAAEDQAAWVGALHQLLANKPNLVFLRYALKAAGQLLDQPPSAN